jgi:hypothetical protein
MALKGKAKTEMKGDKARYCTRAEAKRGARRARREADKRAAREGR